MKTQTRCLCIFLVAIFVQPVLAKRPASSFPSFTLKATGIAYSPAELDHSNQLKRRSGLFSLNYTQPISRRFSVGVSAKYDQLDYQWRSPALFESTIRPFGDVIRYRGGVSLTFRDNSGWLVLISPSIQYAYAEGASRSGAQNWGATAIAMKLFKGGNMLGFGLGYFNDIKDVRTLPIIAIKWNINEQWSLGNPFQTGFTGQAGLELTYQAQTQWQLGMGGAKRTQRFLVASNNISTVEIDEWVSFLRCGYQITETFSINGYVGYLFDANLELSDSGHKEQISPHAATALSLSYTF